MNNEMPRLNLKELPDVLVKTPKQKNYDLLMELYEAGGWSWENGYLPTAYMLLVGPTTVMEAKDHFREGDSIEDKSERRRITIDEFCEMEEIDQLKRQEVIRWFKYNKPNRRSVGLSLI